MDPKGRTLISVDPCRVDSVEFYGPAFKATYDGGEDFPAASRIIMKGKQEYVVQGDVDVVTCLLNAARDC
jgi:hypothetical protein